MLRVSFIFAILFASAAVAADLPVKRPSCKELAGVSIAFLSPADAKRCKRKTEPEKPIEFEWQILVAQDKGAPRPYKAQFKGTTQAAFEAADKCRAETRRECMAHLVGE